MTPDDRDETTTLELRFFATFREAVGQKSVEREYDAGATVGDVLAAIESTYPELGGEILDGGGDIQPQLTVLKNGREVVHLEGTGTELEDGDRLSVFPPVAGGSVRETRRFRGISRRLAAEYLQTLGAERVDEWRFEGDRWAASISAETVSVPGSIELTEVTVEFEGDVGALEPVVEAFARKAMRAGG